VATSRERFALKGHTNRVAAAAFSPDGKTLATGSWDATVKLWEVPSAKPEGVATTGRLKTTLEGHKGSVLAVAYGPDGKRLASAGTYQRLFREGGPRGGIRKIEDGSEVRLCKSRTGKRRPALSRIKATS